jgi:microcompartment protein CcmK/EutM
MQLDVGNLAIFEPKKRRKKLKLMVDISVAGVPDGVFMCGHSQAKKKREKNTKRMDEIAVIAVVGVVNEVSMCDCSRFGVLVGALLIAFACRSLCCESVQRKKMYILIACIFFRFLYVRIAPSEDFQGIFCNGESDGCE